MTNSLDDSNSLDALERRWRTVSEQMHRPQNLMKPLNTDLCLRNLRKSIFDLGRYNKSLASSPHDSSRRNTYTEEDILAFWEEIKRRPELQNNEKAIRTLLKETLNKGVYSILTDDLLNQLIDTHTLLFFTPMWLRRYYFFYFDSLYLSNNQTLQMIWGKLLGQCFGHLMKEGSLHRHGSIKLRYLPLVETLNFTITESDGLKLELFEDYMKKLLQLAPLAAKEDLASLERYYRISLGFDILPSGIRRYCQKHLFNIYLSTYKDNLGDTTYLNNLLEQFCPLDTSIGQDHLVSLITEAYGGPSALKKLALPIKSCIQSFLIRTIKDPRLNDTAWKSLRARNKSIYDGLRYWFVEADFDLFFEFAFRNSRDDHKRKEIWSKFLKQAHDFRVFLPSFSYNEFRSQEKDENKHTQVYRNNDHITGFLMCIENLVIYEAVETGNAAYIFDCAELEVNPSHDAKMVLRYLSHLFEKNALLGGSRTALAHTSLAPLPTDYNSRNIKSRRFTHDRNLIWHDQVLDYLKRNYLIVPDSLD